MWNNKNKCSCYVRGEITSILCANFGGTNFGGENFVGANFGGANFGGVRTLVVQIFVV